MCRMHLTKYPEEEGTIYRGTVNSGYYKNPDRHIDDMLTDEERESEDAHLFMILRTTSNFVTNIIHGIGL